MFRKHSYSCHLRGFLALSDLPVSFIYLDYYHWRHSINGRFFHNRFVRIWKFLKRALNPWQKSFCVAVFSWSILWKIWSTLSVETSIILRAPRKSWWPSLDLTRIKRSHDCPLLRHQRWSSIWIRTEIHWVDSHMWWTSSGKKNKFNHFLVVVQVINRLTQADIRCTTTAR